jgi:hypothetical protein
MKSIACSTSASATISGHPARSERPASDHLRLRDDRRRDSQAGHLLHARAQEINVSCDQLTVESIEHGYVSVDPHDKFDLLMGFLEYEQPTLAIVFTNTKQGARRLAERLKKRASTARRSRRPDAVAA